MLSGKLCGLLRVPFLKGDHRQKSVTGPMDRNRVEIHSQ